MNVRKWIVSFAAVAALAPLAARAESRTAELSCVNKSGENMYRAADGSVVWTDACGFEARCADALVTLGATANSRTIYWYGGGSCHVVNAALKSPQRRGPTGVSTTKRRRPRGTR